MNKNTAALYFRYFARFCPGGAAGYVQFYENTQDAKEKAFPFAEGGSPKG